MHSSCHAWVGEKVAEYDLAGRSTLEVGSYDVNGTVRSWFHGAYVGVDMQAGPGVDVVANCLALPYADEAFAVVVSTEMLEHVALPWRAVAELARVLASGGVLVLTARGYDERGCWEVHGYPNDFYRYSAGAMETLIDLAGLKVQEVTRDSEGPGWFCVGVKP